MSNEEVIRQWLNDPENPELIEQVERMAEEQGEPVVIDDEYIRRIVRQEETQGTPLARASTPPHAGQDKTGRTGQSYV